MTEISGPREICAGVWSSGEAGRQIIEQSLLVRTDRGLVLITGCAHPGIVGIVERAKKLFGPEGVFMALGGFHLKGESEAGIEKVIGELKRPGLRRAGPSHCSGDLARKMFQREFGEGYQALGAGAVVKIAP